MVCCFFLFIPLQALYLNTFHILCFSGNFVVQCFCLRSSFKVTQLGPALAMKLDSHINKVQNVENSYHGVTVVRVTVTTGSVVCLGFRSKTVDQTGSVVIYSVSTSDTVYKNIFHIWLFLDTYTEHKESFFVCLFFCKLSYSSFIFIVYTDKGQWRVVYKQ